MFLIINYTGYIKLVVGAGDQGRCLVWESQVPQLEHGSKEFRWFVHRNEGQSHMSRRLKFRS
jgi:hypothetical protein